jgi:hypothetical protein
MEWQKSWIGVACKGILLKQENLLFHMLYTSRIWLETSFKFAFECWAEDKFIHVQPSGQGDDAIHDRWRQHNLQQNHPNQ